MKYKVGDRVRIKSIDWYNRHTNGTEVDCGGVPFTSDMKWFCSCVMTISFVHADCYGMVEDLENYYTDEMIEGLVKDENNRLTETVVDYVKESNDRYRIVIDPRFDIEVDEGEYYAVRRKKEYPKTYEECARIMRVELWNCLWGEDATEYEEQTEDLMDAFIRLKVCRDAYWKIAGEEMGLGKPWEPDWNSEYFIPAIICRSGFIQRTEVLCRNAILAFPTEEMRDAFKENFDPDIEICKEFL